MYRETLKTYREYLQLKNYSASSITGQLRQARLFEEARENGNDYYQVLLDRKAKNPAKDGAGSITKNTFNHYLYCLKCYVNFLQEIGQPVPTGKLLTAKNTLVKTEILTIEEVKILFRATQEKPQLATRDKAVLACLYHLGLRAGEAANLKPDDLDFTENLVFVEKTKTGYQRQVPMSEHAKTIFLNYLENRVEKQDCFLQGLKGNLNANSVQQIVKRIADQANLKKRVYPHLLRHSIASHLLQSGMALREVSRFLGHRSLESTERYTHLANQIHDNKIRDS